MPVEFALRPRIRLREDSPPPARSRVRLPRFALPVAAYWLAIGGITYAFVHGHDAPPPLASGALDDAALTAEPAPRESRPWWRRVPEAPAPEVESVPPRTPPAAPPAATEEVIAETAPEPASLPAPTPPLVPEPPPRAAFTAPPEPPEPRVPSESRLARQALVPAAPRSSHTPLSEPAERRVLDAPPAAAPAPEAPPLPEARNHGLPSCEAAIESAHQDVDFSQGNGTADLPTSVIAAVLENGAWLSSCNVPASTSLEVCVAIRGGSVIGASVVARPANADVTACVRRRASSLQFPYSSHVDLARTRF